jgi:SpoVK/Ycf46/Vps4 family AAA+-type ATPase
VSALRSEALTRQVGDLLHVEHHPSVSFDEVAGGDALKTIVAQAVRDGIFHPLGLYGPPGVGKTLLASAAARELGYPLIHVDGRLKGGVVGETARNLARFRETIVAYAPAVVFWDEIDLLLGSSNDYNGDSGASNEVRQAVLRFLQDAPVLGVLVIAASNNPFSKLQHRIRNRMRAVPILHPTGTAPLTIARLEASKLDVTLSADAEDVFGAGSQALWNGRDIGRILLAARSNALMRHPADGTKSTVTLQAADLHLLVSHLLTAKDDAAELNALEAIYVTDNPFDLPWMAAQAAGRTPDPLPRYLTSFVDTQGLPDRPAILDRLRSQGVTDAH